MTPLSDAIPAVLQSVLSLEVRLMENCHTNEHIWERKGYRKIEKLLDKCVSRARCRKRALLDRIIAFDVDPDTSGGPTMVYKDLSDIVQYLLDTHVALNDAYQSAISVCRQVDDSVTEDLLNDAQCGVQKALVKAEALQRKISDVGGEQVYLATIAN